MRFSKGVESHRRVGVMILAAGGSVRMGMPKQLLKHRGQTLLRSAVETAVASSCQPVVVVIGAHAELMSNELDRLTISVALNRNWREGMSSSIRSGLETLSNIEPGLDGVVIMLCDQPFITPGALNDLVEAHRQTGKAIVASEYAGVRGVPAFFSSELFAELATLAGNEGAKRVIANHPDEVTTVSFPAGIVDVDTPQDYALLKIRAESFQLIRRHPEVG